MTTLYRILFILFLSCYLLYFGCARKAIQANTIPDGNVTITPTPTVTPVPLPLSTPVPEIVSLDEDFQKSMKPLWDNYFKEDFSDTRTIDLLIATNRKTKNGKFGCSDEQLSVNLESSTQYGLCKINVPKNHTIGQINFTKNNRQSSHEYFKILNARTFAESNFVELIKKTKRIPLVFVHGFNVRYQEAVLRASQIAYDLKYQGPVILFSWPAGAGDGFFDENMITRTYEANTKNATDSVAPFKKFLQLLKANQLKVNLVVHSMGHQVVLPALKELGDTESEKLVVNELILNAPDYDASDFTKLVESIKKVVGRITLYCSFNDKAMLASKSLNKNERVGACTYSEDVDSVNVSLVDAESLGLGHGYYSSRAILSDVFQVLMGLGADKRLFIHKSEPNSTEKYILRP